MSDIKKLLETANRKCEMNWKVYAFNPEKDNELAEESPVFQCIKKAAEYKREVVEKHPDYIVEIVAESKQKNEDVIPAVHDSLIIRYKDKHDKADFDAIVKMLKELLKKASFITFSDVREELEGWRYSKDDIDKIIVAIGGKPESSQKNEDDGDFQETYKDHKILFNWRGKDCYIQNKAGDEVEVVAKGSNATKENLVRAAKVIIDRGNIDFSKKFAYESAQINETRGYKVLVELGVPDNMNNRDIEDEVERLLRTSNKISVVIDVTAERK